MSYKPATWQCVFPCISTTSLHPMYSLMLLSDNNIILFTLQKRDCENKQPNHGHFIIINKIQYSW